MTTIAATPANPASPFLNSAIDQLLNCLLRVGEVSARERGATSVTVPSGGRAAGIAYQRRPMECASDASHLHSCTTHCSHPKDKPSGKGILLDKVEVDHGDHTHEVWQARSMARQLREAVTWKINQDQEGCPCCVAGLDFDEFAVAIKELKHADGGKSEQLAQLADFGDAGHWGIFFGVSAPLGLIGLTAAVRNVRGSVDNLKALKHVILGVSKDIERYKANPTPENVKIVGKLQAFKDTLTYSTRDAKFNAVFPGVVNGVASSLVLSTAIVSHPFALPAIAMYATGQLARNTYDLHRNFERKLDVLASDGPQLVGGKLKVNQVHQSKQRFYAANGAGFAAFAVGATLTFLSIPALSIGIGAVGLPLGLALLSTGALSTGIMNNIWPRKFRPRNGDLGVERTQIQGQDHCLREIQRRREHKKILATFGSGILSSALWKKRFLKVLTAMPQFKDFMPKSWAQKVDGVFPLLKKCGTAATARKHRLNMQLVANAHKDPFHAESLDYRRLLALKQMAKAEVVNAQKPLQQSWALLGKLDLQAQVLDIMLNESFQVSSGHSHDHSHSHKHNHAHLEEASKKASGQKKSGCCHHHHEVGELAGLRKLSRKRSEFNFDEFMSKSSVKDQNKLRMSMDYYLYFVHRKQMQYQQYGLIDYLWSAKKAMECK